MSLPSIAGTKNLISQGATSLYQTLWQGADYALDSVKNLKNKTSDTVGSFVSHQFFFPLRSKAKEKQLRLEEEYCVQFWHGAKMDPILKEQARVRECFQPPENISYSIQLNDKKVQMQCCVIESKLLDQSGTKPSSAVNIVFIPGNHSTNKNRITDIYPYLISYLNKRGSEDEQIGRFIIMSAYDILDENEKPYTPHSLHEAGTIFKKTLECLQYDYGPIEVIGQSLGAILLGAAIEQFDINSTNYLPKSLVFDRGPSSIYEASKNVKVGCLPYGLVIYPVAWMTGWTLNLDQVIADFCFRHVQHLDKGEMPITITGVSQDHRFYGNANLGKSPKLNAWKIRNTVQVLQFDWPQQLFHETSHHSLSAASFYPNYLIGEDDGFFQKDEHLADAFMRKSLSKVLKVVSEGKRKRNELSE